MFAWCVAGESTAQLSAVRTASAGQRGRPVVALAESEAWEGRRSSNSQLSTRATPAMIGGDGRGALDASSNHCHARQGAIGGVNARARTVFPRYTAHATGDRTPRAAASGMRLRACACRRSGRVLYRRCSACATTMPFPSPRTWRGRGG